MEARIGHRLCAHRIVLCVLKRSDSTFGIIEHAGGFVVELQGDAGKGLYRFCLAVDFRVVAQRRLLSSCAFDTAQYR